MCVAGKDSTVVNIFATYAKDSLQYFSFWIKKTSNNQEWKRFDQFLHLRNDEVLTFLCPVRAEVRAALLILVRPAFPIEFEWDSLSSNYHLEH